MQGQHDIKFFVYIVESPSAQDVYLNRSEGSLLVSALGLSGIPCAFRTAISHEAFVAALKVGFPEVMKRFPGKLPILHLSAHGNTHGIQLSDGSSLGWTGLRSLIEPINQSLNGILILCMSACQGYSACQMAMRVDDEPHPYFVMIGNAKTPTWADTAVAYSSFYHLLWKGFIVQDAVEGMVAASGDDGWLYASAEDSKKFFIEYNASEMEAAQRNLSNAANTASLPEGAKVLEANGGLGIARAIEAQFPD